MCTWCVFLFLHQNLWLILTSLFLYSLTLRTVEVKRKAVQRIEEQLMKLQVQATDREENKQIALGTSKLNYLDPRISVAWYLRTFFLPTLGILWSKSWNVRVENRLMHRPAICLCVAGRVGLTSTSVTKRQEMALHCRKRSSRGKKASGCRMKIRGRKSVWVPGTMGFVSES